MDTVDFERCVIVWTGMLSVRPLGREPARRSLQSLCRTTAVSSPSACSERNLARRATPPILTLRRPPPLSPHDAPAHRLEAASMRPAEGPVAGASATGVARARASTAGA